MEHARELNEAAESSLETPHVKRIESEEVRPQLVSRDVQEEPPDRVASGKAEWPENFALIRSPEMLLECMAGRSLSSYSGGSQSQSEQLCMGQNDSGNSEPRVKDITVKNDGSAELLIGDESNREGKQPVGQSLWHNFTRLSNRIKEEKSKKPLSISRRDNADNASQTSFGDRGAAVETQFDQKNSKATENTSKSKKQEISTTQLMSSPGAIRTKVLNASGFQQFFVKSTLKGKGVAYMDQSTNDAAGEAITKQDTGKPNASPGNYLISRSETKVDGASFLYSSGSGVGNLSRNDVTLREWLRTSNQKYNKTDRMCIFKQILDFVDMCHSQGIALQNLWPSCFAISSSNQIKYVGSFIRQSQIKDSRTLVARNLPLFDNQLKRKRYTEEEKGTREGGTLNNKNIDKDNRFGTLHHIQHPRGYPINIVHRQDNRDNSCIGRKSGSFKEVRWQNDHSSLDTRNQIVSTSIDHQGMPELKKLEGWWYASPEEFNDSRCPFSSNIFSLGVLLFELISHFETWEFHCAAMSDLRHRILPPNILSESPKEAGFCLWLLHPDPSSRPKSTDILASDLINETPDLPSLNYSAALIEEEDSDADLLLHFLLSLKEQKEKQAAKLAAGLRFLKEDIEELNRRNLARAEFVSNENHILKELNSDADMYNYGKPAAHTKETVTPISSPYEERLMQYMEQLENGYFFTRTTVELSESNALMRSDNDVLKFRDSCHSNQVDTPDNKANDHVGAFFEGLCKYACYSKFQLQGHLKNVDILNSANVICSLGFDRDEEYIAAAGVSKKIKIFEYAALLNESVDIHYPLVELSSRSKLSCISWNSYIKNYLLSTDYEGVVQLWDASCGQGLTQFAEHRKRAWSVHFSQVDPTKLASGSDDCSVKLWSINEKNSIDTIRSVANICSVQFSPYSSHLLAFGSSDYRIYCYDLRNTRNPWCTLAGHGKAVSYVKFLDSTSVVSASTDSSLKLWDLNRTNSSGPSTNACKLTFNGHTNEKNFIGLSICNGYISCGSETNEVFAYYKTFPMPITSYKFGSIDPITAQETEDDNGQFVSSVCWREKSNVVVTANSTGSIKVLQLV